MKNKLIDLNNHLFTQLERLCEEGIEGDKLDAEIKKSKAITGVANNIINNGRLALDAQKALHDRLIPEAPEMIGIKGIEIKEGSRD